MKVVDLQTLRALPVGTPFQKAAPNYLEGIEIFRGAVGDDDFCSVHLDSLVDPHGISEMIERGGVEAPDFDGVTRDAVHKQDQLFAVWEPDDVRALIARLQAALPQEG